MRKKRPDPTAAAWWNIVVPKIVPRGEEGDFHRTAKGIFLEVARPVTLDFHTIHGPAVCSLSPGDLVRRATRQLSEAEQSIVFATTGRKYESVRIAVAYRDSTPIDTCMRQLGRHIPNSVKGWHLLIRGMRYYVPGQLDHALDEAAQAHLEGIYAGIIFELRELRRIEIKICRGFETAMATLAAEYSALLTVKRTAAQSAKRIAGLWTYLLRVAAFNPYWTWIREPEIAWLADPASVTSQPSMLEHIETAFHALEKAVLGTKVTPREIRKQARRRA